MERYGNQALTVASANKRIFAHNALMTSRLPKAYPEKHKPYKLDTIFKAVTGGAGGSPKLSEFSLNTVSSTDLGYQADSGRVVQLDTTKDKLVSKWRSGAMYGYRRPNL